MKNLHLIRARKSRLYYTISMSGYNLKLSATPIHQSSEVRPQYIYITSEEEIRLNDYITDGYSVWKWKDDSSLLGKKKVILTTDPTLIADGIQEIDDEFLEWFVNNPSCEEVEVMKQYKDGYGNWYKYQDDFNFTDLLIRYKIIIPKEEPKQETLEHKSKFIVFTLQDSEDWVQHSIPLDSFEKADDFCQQFRDKKMSYLICKTLKQGYNGK